jgi:pilus assembly protein CpaB
MFLRVMAVLLGLVGLAGVGLALIGLQQRPATPAQVAVASAAPSAPVAQRSILAAARTQHAGNLMVADDVTAIQVVPGAEPPGSFIDSVANRTALRGAMVRRAIAANEPILASDVLNAGDRGFLAAVLGAGKRAVSVGVDNVSGTAGLIWPGDRVDLVLTQQVDDRDQPADRRVYGETVLVNLRVIAVDQQLVQGGQGGQAANANTNRTITIEASPYDTERIAVASRLGRLSLVVRSATEDDQVAGSGAPGTASEQPPIAWAGDVSPALRDHTKGVTGNSIHLYHGPTSVDEVKF